MTKRASFTVTKRFCGMPACLRVRSCVRSASPSPQVGTTKRGIPLKRMRRPSEDEAPPLGRHPSVKRSEVRDV